MDQVGDAGYRIDLGVIDQEMPGRYICGLECDGATYHSAATVRDRDRLRQEVLEMRGWNIHRVWSTDWFQDPKGQIDRVTRLIEESHERLRRGETQELEEAPKLERDPPAVPVEQEPEISRVDLQDIEVAPYRFAPVVDRGTSETFYTVPTSAIAGAVQDVLEVEGPIHLSELSRRVAACWGMQRAGSQIVGRVEKAVAQMVKRDAAVREEDFVWLNSGAPIPVRSRSGDGTSFSSDQISPREVVEAVRLLLRHRAPLLPDELVTETARLLGFSRTGSKLRERIETAKEQLVAAGELRPGSRGIHLAEPV